MAKHGMRARAFLNRAVLETLESRQLLSATVANFTGGNGTSSVDQYTGTAGSGWATPWTTDVYKTTSTTGVLSASPLNGGGNYLSGTFTGSGTPSLAVFARAYNTVSGGVDTGQAHTISFDVRVDSDLSTFTDTQDRINIWGDDSLNYGTTSGSTSGLTWVLTAYGAVDGGVPAKNWTWQGGDRAGNYGPILDTGIPLVQGHVYHVTITNDPMSQSYVGSITDLQTSATNTSPVLAWRTGHAFTSSTNTYLITGGEKQASSGKTTTISTDSISIAPAPPAAPSSLTATAASSSQVNLAWTDNAFDESGYTVDRATNSTFSSGLVSTNLAAGTTSYPSTGLSAGTTYYYRVRATNGAGASANSNTASAITQSGTTVPAAPSGLTATTASSTQVNLHWTDNSSNETGFKIDGSLSSSFTTFQSTTVGAGVTSYSATGLTPNTTYYFRVRATNAAGDSANTPTASTMTFPTAPAAPTGLTATGNAAGTAVTLAWTDAATNETGYTVERQVTGGGTWTTLTSSLAANSTGYADTTASAGTAYTYRVSATNAGGSGQATIGVTTVPAAPASLSASASSSTAVSLTWSAVAGATGYNVYRGTAAGGESPTPVNGTPLTVANYGDTGLTSGTTYYYVVRVLDAGGTGLASAEAHAAPTATAPAAPLGLTATAASATQVNLTWTDAATNETSYTVERQVTGSGTWTTLTSSLPANSASYSDTTASAATAYTYRVSAVNAGGSGSSTASTTTPPTAPAMPTATSSGAGISLVWSAVAGATGYNVYRGTAAGGESSTPLNASPLTTTNYVDASLTASTPYYYVVRATGAGGTGAASPEASATAPSLPAAPSSLTATPASATQVNLTWTDTATNETKYTVERQVSGGGTWTTLAASLPANTASYSDTTATAGTAYTYRVSAVNVVGSGSSTAPATTVPAAPASLTVTTASASELDLSWPAVAGATGYNVYRGTVSGGESPAAINASPVTSTSYPDVGLTAASTYYYVVRAIDAGGTGAASPEGSAATGNPSAPAAPTNLSYTASATTVTLAWTDAATNETSYAVERSADGGGTWGPPVNLPANSTGYTDTTASAGTTYTYRASATNAGGSGRATISATTLPGQVTGLSASPASSSAINLSWSAVTGATGYDVYRGTTAGGESPMSIGRVTAPSYADTNLAASTTYYYYVRAVDTTGSGTASTEAHAATSAAANQPLTITQPAAASPATVTGKSTNLTVAASGGAGPLTYTWANTGRPTGAAEPTLDDNASNTAHSVNATFSGAGSYTFTVTVSDGATTASSSVTVAVAQMPTGITITPGVAGVTNGHTRQFAATVLDQFGQPLATQPTIAWTVDAGGAGSVSPAGVYAAPAAGSGSGTATVRAAADGFQATAAVTTNNATGRQPLVQITSLGGSGTYQISQDTPIRGIVDAPDDNLTSWTLSLVPLTGTGQTPGTNPIVVASGTSEVGAGPSTDGALGTIRATALQSGIYQLVLSASDSAHGSPVTVSRQVQVNTQLKLGNFTLPITDLTVNTSGLPIVISRRYDSSVAGTDRGDFGPGWRLELPDVGLQTTAQVLPQTNRSDSNTYPSMYQGDQVSLTLPGGRVEVFAFNPAVVTPPDPYFGTGGTFAPAFTSLTDPGSTLTVDQTRSDTGDTIQLTQDAAGKEFYDLSEQNPQRLGGYNPALSWFGAKYYLTTNDGTKYTIDARSGKVTTETDPNGDTVDFTNPNQITSTRSNGQGTVTVLIHRNSANHIDYVQDPRGNRVLYAYDAAGNLTGVTYRQALPNGNPALTTYGYTDPTHTGTPHYLSDVIDERGVDVVHAGYDASGVLNSLQDANHLSTPVSTGGFSGTSASQVWTDLVGNTVENVFDAHGGVLRSITTLRDPNTNALIGYSVAVHQYQYGGPAGDFLQEAKDGQSFVIHGSDAAGNRYTQQPTVWAKITDYDGSGNISTVSIPGTGTSTRQVTTYANYKNGRPQTVTDALGNVTQYNYDAAGNLLWQKDALGEETDYRYDTTGTLPPGTLLETYRTVNGQHQTLHSYGYYGAAQNYRLQTDTDATGVTHTYAYDANGNQLSDSYRWTDPTNSSNAYTVEADTTYDASDRATAVVSGKVTQVATGTVTNAGTTGATAYNETDKVASTTDAYGRTTFYDYGARGNLIQTRYPDGTVTRTVYDALGRPQWEVDRYKPGSPDAGAIGTHTLYDSLGRVYETDRVAGVVIAVETDSSVAANAGETILRSRLVSQGAVISTNKTVYDDAGRAAIEVGPDGQPTNYTYYDDGRIHTTTNALNQTTTYAYGTTTVSGATVEQDTVTDPVGNQTTSLYDPLGRVTKVTYPDQNATRTVYGPFGDQVTSYDQLNNATDRYYDAAGRLIEVKQPAVADADNGGAMTRPHWHYAYDGNGNLRTVTDPKGHATTYTYDPLGRELTRQLPGGGTETTTYDAFGRKATYTDFAGDQTVYSYFPGNTGDAQAGQLKEADYYRPGKTPGTDPADETVQYTYTALGQPLTTTDSADGGITTDGYDANGNLTSVASPQGTVHYVFDPATGFHTETYTSQTDTLYGYDALGRLQTVTVNKLNGKTLATPLVTTYGYDLAGGPDTSVTDANGIETDTHVDLVHDEQTITTKKGSTTLATDDYHFDADGRDLNVVEHQADVGGSTFSDTRIDRSYDADGRLTSEKYDAGNNGPGTGDYTTKYQYDLANNRKVKTVDTGSDGTTDQTITSTYDTDDKLTQTADSTSGTTTFTYDGNGSLKTSTHGGVTDAYTYDVRNRLTGATVGGQSVAYTYNDAGDRTSETSGGVTTTLLNDDQNPTGYGQVLEEHQGSATPTQTYVLGGNVLGQVNATGNASYLIADARGSTRLLTDASGAVTGSYHFDGFGTAIGSTSGTRYLFDGQRFDPVLGQYDNRAREYDPANGVFDSIDPLNGRLSDPLTLNHLIFAGDDPINAGDPNGMEFDFVSFLFSSFENIYLEASDAVESTPALGEAGAVAQSVEEESVVEEGLAESLNAPESVQNAQSELTDIVENQQSELQQAIDEGGAEAKGQYFNQLGKRVQDIADRVINEAAPEGAEIQPNYAPLGEEGIGMQLDSLVQSGGRKALIETKYSLPRAGSSLTRLINQLKVGSQSLDEGEPLILNVARGPTSRELASFLTKLPANLAGRVQIVSNAEQLYNAVQTAFAVAP